MTDCCRAYGGPRKLAAIEAMESHGELTVQETPVGPLTLGVVNYARGDDRLRIETTSPFGGMVQVSTASRAGRRTPWASRP